MIECMERRVKADLKAAVRYRIRSKLSLQVLDLNEGGCLLEAHGWSARPDERVLIRLPGLSEIAASIIWVEDHKAGVAFEEPLYGPVVEGFFEAA